MAAASLISGLSVSAQQYAANEYRVCPADQTERGIRVVEERCGRVARPALEAGQIQSINDLKLAEAERNGFKSDVAAYGNCVNAFINSYRRPGADATSTAPDEAACAHAWAEDQVTQSVMEYGRACVEYSNRSITDSKIEPWSGDCYPEPTNGRS
ncbi:MAG: hypothetical protein AAF950_13690 [Pseudomonadota bacterium]